MDIADPDIRSNEDSVSSHAINHDAQFALVVEAATRGEREGELQVVVATIKAAPTLWWAFP